MLLQWSPHRLLHCHASMCSAPVRQTEISQLLGVIQGDIVVKQLDLSDLASVKAFSRDFLTTEKGPDLLILNAGVMGCPLGYTKDGFEMQIGTSCVQTSGI